MEHGVVVLPEQLHEVVVCLDGKSSNDLLRPPGLFNALTVTLRVVDLELGVDVAIHSSPIKAKSTTQLIERQVAPCREQAVDNAIFLVIDGSADTDLRLTAITLSVNAAVRSSM